MKKILSLTIFCICAGMASAQYGTVNAILDRLEARRGINQDLKDVNIDDAKFVLIKDFDDHTERSFIIIKGNLATYVEMFDDKKTGESSSNVFSGDVVRTEHNLISLRADKLEGEKIALPVTKTLLMTKQKKILYLVDVNTKDRWVEESALTKK
ncbi:hypothetical protein [Kaistella palustris]|uniref:hypothetical protein n=1 Tax=Kaistella palustris TaxID=493376 RepID=UPI00041763CA|nr:hypothetical protein [Kaistella palustris]